MNRDQITLLAEHCFTAASNVLEVRPDDAALRVAAEWRQLGDALVRWLCSSAG